MRAKEFADDYRYFPEPDLPPLLIEEAELQRASAALPELPAAKEERLRREWGLPVYDAALLADGRDLAEYFEATARALGDGKAASNWIMGEVLNVVRERGVPIASFPVPPQEVAGLLALVRDGSISGKIAKAVFAEMVETRERAGAIIARRGVRQVSAEAALTPAIESVLDANPGEVARYLSGKTTLRGFFVGQVMAATQGQANPALANRLVAEALERRRA
jgi:aspartyl-tRNA(Asn)/glutamyl-tRNA(Gln) amidotransferase subunit B